MKRQFYIFILLAISSHGNAQNDTIRQTEEVFIRIVEKMPEFIGGYEALTKYINTNTIYTEKASNEKVTGKVFVSFYVETDGSITEPTIVRGLHPDLDSISLALIKNMPNWTPGTQRGEPIKCKYNLPIEFGLYKNKTKKTKEFKTSKYWSKKSQKKFMKICISNFKKSSSECNCWFDFIVWNYNKKKLEELNLHEIFKTKKCN